MPHSSSSHNAPGVKNSPDAPDYHALAEQIKVWGRELGFQQVGITDVDLAEDEAHLQRWLDAGHHGEMGFMAKHGTKRTRPDELEPGTIRVISVRLDYLSPEVETTRMLARPEKAYVSRYALGRDYHKLMRKRLAQLARQMQQVVGPFGFRAFVDSAPVMERGLARKAGLGWFGKNAMLLNPKAGSLFFLGELYTDLPLPIDPPYEKDHCGSCSACRTACPTGAIIEDKVVDARACISYLTIELHDAIPEQYREAMGNRVFGCDDCQLVCPWNKFARRSDEPDFRARNDLDTASLADLFAWEEDEFLRRTEGSAIRRSGHRRWLRNIAVALGNAPTTPQVLAALRSRADSADPLVREHVAWALARHAG